MSTSHYKPLYVWDRLVYCTQRRVCTFLEGLLWLFVRIVELTCEACKLHDPYRVYFLWKFILVYKCSYKLSWVYILSKVKWTVQILKLSIFKIICIISRWRTKGSQSTHQLIIISDSEQKVCINYTQAWYSWHVARAWWHFSPPSTCALCPAAAT